MIKAGTFLAVFTASLVFSAQPARADQVAMRVVFENTTEDERKMDEVRKYLPLEIRKDDVLDLGGLQVDYDPAKSTYFVFTNAVLKPGQKMTYKMIVKDVWTISEPEIQFIRDQIRQHVSSQEGKENENEVRQLGDKLLAELDAIQKAQTEKMENVQKRIDQYRVQKERLREIRNAGILLKDFQQEAELQTDFLKEEKVMKLVLQTRNPSDAEVKKNEVTRYLPEGITPDLIEDSQGFDIKFDTQKRQYYLSRVMELQPGEKKSFEIRIKDRWRIPDLKLNDFAKKTDSLLKMLTDTEFKDESIYLANEIYRYIQEIEASQAADLPIKDKISNYTLNVKKMEAIQINIREIERMAELRKEKERLNMTEEVIKKLVPNTAMTWKIIYGTITFLTIISSMSYILWWGQTRRGMGREFKDAETKE